ncbi:hypothetical protein T440DRAFT_184618 [Plenodomus tracheiphilus IPT5]|uniref:Uncharacterized protein n=1 Tax=Plenodomus tracheiphilus IPT5 TaxID=1408161 RepID=A0A6A7AXB4_9PLEO|nr:hypothetical protein T440DRAFT_184618 [Plenodomus tracheiphilus IPT5]
MTASRRLKIARRNLRRKKESKKLAKMLKQEMNKSRTLENMLDSPLLRLPGEIRNIIYEYAMMGNVIEEPETTWSYTTAPTTPETKGTVPVALNFLSVSRQVYAETRILLFKHSALKIHDLNNLRTLKRNIISAQWNAITTIILPVEAVSVRCISCHEPFCPTTHCQWSFRKDELDYLEHLPGLQRVIIDWRSRPSMEDDDYERDHIGVLIQEAVAAGDQEVKVVFEGVGQSSDCDDEMWYMADGDDTDESDNMDNGDDYDSDVVFW